MGLLVKKVRMVEEVSGCMKELSKAVFAHLGPHLPLPAPVGNSGDRPHVSFQNRVSALHCIRKKEDILLDVRSEVEQIHDLGDACTGYVAQAGEVRIVLYIPSLDQSLKADRQSQELRNPRYVPFAG